MYVYWGTLENGVLYSVLFGVEKEPGGKYSPGVLVLLVLDVIDMVIL